MCQPSIHLYKMISSDLKIHAHLVNWNFFVSSLIAYYQKIKDTLHTTNKMCMLWDSPLDVCVWWDF